MGFKERPSLDTDNTVTIGGVNEKTGKPNPKSIEGYFLGTKITGPNKYNRSKMNKLHVLQTEDGNVGVWGKTNMDQKLAGVTPGTMIRITFTGEKDVGKGNPMLCYKVEEDTENTIEVGTLDSGLSSEEEETYEPEDETDPEDEEPTVDEVPPARAQAPKKAAQTPSAERQAKVKSLLGGRRPSA